MASQTQKNFTSWISGAFARPNLSMDMVSINVQVRLICYSVCEQITSVCFFLNKRVNNKLTYSYTETVIDVCCFSKRGYL
jgi:hypothetical protein